MALWSSEGLSKANHRSSRQKFPKVPRAQGDASSAAAAQERQAVVDELLRRILNFAERAVAETDYQFLQELDFSPVSIERIEWLASEFDRHPEHWESPEEQSHFVILWGVYIGEVLRRHCGGQWVVSGETVALQAAGLTLYPLAKVQQRLTEGPVENLVSYYSVWADLIGGEPGAAAAGPCSSL